MAQNLVKFVLLAVVWCVLVSAEKNIVFKNVQGKEGVRDAVLENCNIEHLGLEVVKRHNPPQIKLQWDRWATSQLVTSVAAVLLTHKLGDNVELHGGYGSGGRQTKWIYRKIAVDQSVDAALETWPTGKEDQFKQFASHREDGALAYAVPHSEVFAWAGIYETTDRNSLKTRGGGPAPKGILELLENQTRFLPPIENMIDWNKTGAIAEYFNPNPYCETKECVTLLHAGRPYNTGLLENMTRDLELPLRFAYVKDLNDYKLLIWTAHTREQWGLFHGWYPNEYFVDTSFNVFSRVTVDPSQKHLKFQRLEKVLSPSMDEDAFHFLERFTLNRSHYDSLTDYLHNFNYDVSQAACLWVQENEDVWKDIIAFPSRKKVPFGICETPDLCSYGCWMWFFGQLVISVLFLVIYLHLEQRKVERAYVHEQKNQVEGVRIVNDMYCEKNMTKNLPGKFQKKRTEREKKRMTPRASTAPTGNVLKHRRSRRFSHPSKFLHEPGTRMKNNRGSEIQELIKHVASGREVFNAAAANANANQPRDGVKCTRNSPPRFSSLSLVKKTFMGQLDSKLYDEKYSGCVEFLKSTDTPPAFISHSRSLVNFVRPLSDKRLVRPPAFGDLRWISGTARSTLYRLILLSDEIKPVFFLSLSLAFFSGAWGTMLFLLLKWDSYKDHDGTSFTDNEIYIAPGSLGDIVFVSKEAINSITGNFKFYPTFLLIGYMGFFVSRWHSFFGHVFGIQDKLHNAALLLSSAVKDSSNHESQVFLFKCYRYMNLAHFCCYRPLSPWLRELRIKDLETLGLLEHDEIRPLENAVEMGCGYNVVLTWLNALLTEYDHVLLSSYSAHQSTISSIRGKMSDLHDTYVIVHPNSWAALMKCLVDLLVFLYVVGTPFTAFVYSIGCCQVYVIVFSFILALPFACTSGVIQMLSDPFDFQKGSCDTINIDSILGETECICFENLRANIVDMQASTPGDASLDKEGGDGDRNKEETFFTGAAEDPGGVKPSDMAKRYQLAVTIENAV